MSPGFATRYPDIVQPERIPAGFKPVLDAVWRTGDFPNRTVNLIGLTDVFVVADGLVVTPDLKVVDCSIAQHSPAQIESALAILKAQIHERGVAKIDVPTVLCVKPGWQNYGHWLIELLSRADVARRHLAQGLRYLVPQPTGRMSDVVRESLASIGISSSLVMPYDRPVQFEKLILVDGLTTHGTYMSPLAVDTLRRLAQHVPAGDAQNLYVKRKHPAYRRIANDVEVERHLLECGFKSISPEEHSFSEQISLFKGARHVLGPVSAAMTNLVFCDSGTRVDMFYPGSMADTFYWFIAQHRGFAFKDIRCEQVTDAQTHHPWDSDIRVDMKLLESLVPRRPQSASAINLRWMRAR